MSKDLECAAPGQASTLERDSPRLDIADNDAGGLDVGISGKWERIFEAAQNTGVAEGIIAQITNLGAEGRKTDANASAFTLGYVDAMQPRDPAELLLLTQMAATHQAVMVMARRLNLASTMQQRDSAERAMTKTARTFAAQMEALKRYRSKGQQVVRVERVTVEAGARALVGNVETGTPPKI